MSSIKKLITIETLHFILQGVNDVFISLFLWNTFSLSVMLWFKLLEQMVIPVAAILGGGIADKISAKVSFGLGLLFFFIQMVSIVVFRDTLESYLFVIAILGGASSVLRFMSVDVINRSISKQQETSFFGQLSINSQVVGVLFPIISGLIASVLGYSAIFVVALILILYMLFALVKTNLNQTKNEYRLDLLIKQWTKNSTSLVLNRFLAGIESGCILTLMPILITQILQSEFGWGLFTSCIAVVAIMYSRIMKKINGIKNLFGLMVLFGFLLSSSALAVSSSTSPILVLVFFGIFSLWNVTKGVTNSILFRNIMEQNDNFELLKTEYSVLLELPLMAGRTIALAFLFLISKQIDNQVVIGLMFSAVGLIPIYEAAVLGMSKSLKKMVS